MNRHVNMHLLLTQFNKKPLNSHTFAEGGTRHDHGVNDSMQTGNSKC